MKRSRNSVDQEVAATGDLTREQLAQLWEKAHGHLPPKGIRQELLIRSASWHLQVKRLGGISPRTRRLLNAAMAEVASVSRSRLIADADRGDEVRDATSSSRADTSHLGAVPSDVRPVRHRRRRATLLPGARLIRDWNGKTHVVDVIEEGFVFQATVHNSLTAIAHQITGAHWSGPRFFGL